MTPDLFFPLLLPPPRQGVDPTKGWTSRSLLTAPGQSLCTGGCTELPGSALLPTPALLPGARRALGARSQKGLDRKNETDSATGMPRSGAGLSASCLLRPGSSRTHPQARRAPADHSPSAHAPSGHAPAILRLLCGPRPRHPPAPDPWPNPARMRLRLLTTPRPRPRPSVPAPSGPRPLAGCGVGAGPRNAHAP